jgi:hypothetical protein
MTNQTITGIPAHNAAGSTAAMRWPGYHITGAGSLAVVLECSHRVVLVQMPIEAAALAAEKCCATCSHIAAPGAGLHRIVEMEQPRNEAPRRSMRRLPGWIED